MSKKKSLNIVDKGIDRASVPLEQISISERKYEVYFLLTKGGYSQTRVGGILGMTRQAVQRHTRDLFILGVIKPIDSNGNPKFYRAKGIIPVVSTSATSATPVVSTSAKRMERRVGKTPILVRDLSSGKIKSWKSSRKIGHVRDYNTIISVNGKRIPMIRAHSLSYICTILREPLKEVPWTPAKEGMRGMEQFVYRHIFDNKKSTWKQPVLFNLKKIDVTFVRKTTKTTDELVIYMPEKYFLEYELDEAKKILTKYVWQAWKWFQSHFKAHLAFPIEYREMEFAHEIFDPKLSQWVQKKGMAKIKTKRGIVKVDKSKKECPEKEYTTIEQVKADLESGDRILDLEEKVSILFDTMTQMSENITKMAESQQSFTHDIQEFMGFRRKMEKRLEKENDTMFS